MQVAINTPWMQTLQSDAAFVFICVMGAMAFVYAVVGPFFRK